MLLELRIKNYALIDEVNLTFSPGLNILSGETGAGKSIIIGSINLLLGERASTEQIRQGCKSASIEGIIDCSGIHGKDVTALLADAGIEQEDELFLAREIYDNGRSVARVNGRSMPVAFLRELGRFLIDLHGQHQHQSLLRTEGHIELLDSFGGEEISTIRQRLHFLQQKRRELVKQLKELGENSAERERRIDISTFQLREIKSIDPKIGEDEQLADRERILGNVEKLCSLTKMAYNDLYSGMEEGGPAEAITDRLRRSLGMLHEASQIDSTLSPLCDILSSTVEQIDEVSHDLRDYQLKLEYEPEELAVIQERLNQISGLKKKYGVSIEVVLEFAEKLEKEIERLINSEKLAENIETELSDLDKVIAEESSALHLLREKAGTILESKIKDSLKELALPDADFKVEITEKESFTSSGNDNVEFLFTANRGEEVKPLAKIISGGEVSRVMLGLKTVLARQDLVPTLIFDEVDAGVGGVTIQAVAEKLAGLSRNHQVMCVTHSPQIAAMADCHYYLYKEPVDGRTVTRADLLDSESRRKELARMMDGAGIDKVSLQHVDNLVKRAGRFKSGLGDM